MGKCQSIFIGLFFFLLSFGANAQSKTGADYFAGKWNILAKGTPGGDSKMAFVLEKKDTSLTGIVLDSSGKEVSKIDKVELNATTATVYFSAQGYDVNVEMDKKDDEHVTGSLMGMFNIEGDRAKSIQ